MAVNHADGTLFFSTLLFPIAAGVGAHSAGAGWWTPLFLPPGFAVGCAVAYAGRKFIYGVLGFAMKEASSSAQSWIKGVVSVPVAILYMLSPYAFAWIGLLDTWYGSMWVVNHWL